MKIIATDLDRTLMPNGNHQLSPGAMARFKRELKKNKVKLIFGDAFSSIAESVLTTYDDEGEDRAAEVLRALNDGESLFITEKEF